jgi:uncharacterized protein (DUF488 family)
MKAAKPAPLAIHGWTVFAHPLFMSQVEALVEPVEALKKQDPTGYVKKNTTKRAFESRDDAAYRVFRQVLESGHPPDDWHRTNPQSS